MSIVLLEDDNLWLSMTKRHMCIELGGERGGEKQAKKYAYQQRDKVDVCSIPLPASRPLHSVSNQGNN